MANLYKFGETIIEARRQAGLTQEGLASLIGITPQAVSKWENGVGYPDVTLFPDIARVLNIPISRLFGEEEARQNTQPTFPKSVGGLKLCGIFQKRACYSDKPVISFDESCVRVEFADGSVADMSSSTVENVGKGEIRIFELEDIAFETADGNEITKIDKTFGKVTDIHINMSHYCTVQIKKDGKKGECRVEAQGSARFISVLQIAESGGFLNVKSENRHGQSDQCQKNSVTIHTATDTLGTVECRVNGYQKAIIEPKLKKLVCRINGSGAVDADFADTADIKINGSGEVNVKEAAESTKIEINGSGIVAVDKAASPQMSINGSGDITFKNTVGSIKTKINGSGNITCSGNADHLVISICGSGDFHGDGLTVESADIHSQNGSSAEISIKRIKGRSVEKLSRNTVLNVAQRG